MLKQRAFPTSRVYDVSWNLRSNEVEIWASGAKLVEEIHVARDALRARGATILGTGEPRIGAHGTPIIFVHPKDMGGVLVELMETPRNGAH